MSDDLVWDTADVKPCPHGYAVLAYCLECRKAWHDKYHEWESKFPVDECPACTGRGELPVPKTYMTCPCCRGREKIRPCRKCSGKGYA